MRTFCFGLLLLVSSLLASCASNLPRTTVEFWPLYRPAEFAHAGGGRDTYVVLRGHPLALDPAQFEQNVLRDMQGQNWGPRTNFTTHPTDYDNAHKVVMLFNGAKVNGGELCRNPGAIPFRTGPQTELHVMAAYCRYDSAMVLVQGWLTPEGSGVSQEGFSHLIRQVTRELFPPVNPEDSRRDSDNFWRLH